MKTKIEFSKIILALIIFSYFIGLAFGMYVIFEMIKTGNFVYIATALCGLFTYIGAPVSAAIGFYSNKAKAENVEKIKKAEPKKLENNQKIPLN